MSIFRRIQDIVSANLNDLLEGYENPEQLLRQAIREMEVAIQRAKPDVARATGAIGRPLIAELLANGHAVVALTRSSEKARDLLEQGIEPAIADVFDADAVQAAVVRAQPEVVNNSPLCPRPTLASQ